jgi:hypothetical protein
VRLSRLAALVLTGDDGQAMCPTASRGTTLTYEVCGERSVAIRLTGRPNGFSRVALRVAIP